MKTFPAAMLTMMIFVAALLVPGRAGAQQMDAETAAGPLPERREMIVPEPVFNGTVYITEAGMGHTSSVILVHGAGDTGARDWEQLIPVLAKDYHVVAFDLPGFARSSKGNALYSPARYSKFIKWMADEYVKGPFALIGHSLGGALALRYAADYPGDLTRLILVDAAGILHRMSVVKMMYQVKNAKQGSGQQSRRIEEFNEFIRFLFDDLSSDERAKKLEAALQKPSLRRRVLGDDPKKVASIALMLEDFGKIVDRVRTPTLLIWGENDNTAPLRTARALAARLPVVDLMIIPQAGHVPMRDQAEAFDRIVMNELATQRPTAPSAAELQPRDNAERIGRCDGQRGVSFTGAYKRIEVNRCSDVVIADATAGRIDVVSSDVTLENTQIRGTDVALQAKRSEIIGTNVRIEAETAIRASHSHLDLAGAKLAGTKAAVTTDTRAVLLFSISRSDSPNYSGSLHGTRKVTRLKPL